ncbi:hypothetical protein KC19_11G014200 [Ceratodon purpureus]|uniref:Uncharacterized protein n=1 Tax=Ceratodon purpureus TaxID=3225 RepID=A0A8T0GBP3_CERPU|nr:hypothetical protein KC19_11G014200 [Ceratodon purpureus]
MARGSQKLERTSGSSERRRPRAASSSGAPPKRTGGAALNRQNVEDVTKAQPDKKEKLAMPEQRPSESASKQTKPADHAHSWQPARSAITQSPVPAPPKLHTDDAPGSKIIPIVVLVMIVCFIGLVTSFHVVGVLYNYIQTRA